MLGNLVWVGHAQAAQAPGFTCSQPVACPLRPRCDFAGLWRHEAGVPPQSVRKLCEEVSWELLRTLLGNLSWEPWEPGLGATCLGIWFGNFLLGTMLGNLPGNLFLGTFSWEPLRTLLGNLLGNLPWEPLAGNLACEPSWKLCLRTLPENFAWERTALGKLAWKRIRGNRNLAWEPGLRTFFKRPSLGTRNLWNLAWQRGLAT